MSDRKYDLFVVGGCGHAGLPLAVTFALEGLHVAVYDINEAAVEQVRQGVAPHKEDGLAEALPEALKTGRFHVAGALAEAEAAAVVLIAVGTPVDRHHTPSLEGILALFTDLRPLLSPDQLLVMRSTVFPGTIEKLHEYLAMHGSPIDVVYAPERIAEGKALVEIRALPQIIGGVTERATQRGIELFSKVCKVTIPVTPLEAELAKLFSNAWRYFRFAAANQFYMLATEAGADYAKVYDAITRDYPRAKDLPSPGFAAGPCLLKDTLQLEAYNPHAFYLGHAARRANEGLPDFLIAQLRQEHGTLAGKTIGILGMAFKANSDDKRGSLSYRLRRLLEFENATVLCSDPYINEPGFVSADALLERSQIVLIGVPHSVYASLAFEGRQVVDLWGLTRRV